ncbi:hypothetical protein NDI52_31180 [Leptolyngbya sp. PL-A3]|uniref:hypothetical protein n=1 Tax=Leptolyngbya sp. PL-A3 TaxID=2933911 RepID=UPI003297500F
MPTEQELKEQARANARALLSQSEAFRNLDKDGQMVMYRDTVNTQYHQLLNKPALAQAQGLSGAMGTAGASRVIDEERHENRDMDNTGKRAADFMNSVDFPQFVEDLLNGVFDATLNLTHKQMQDYMALLKEATKDVAHFVNQIDDTTAFKYLAENNSDKFNLRLPGEGEAGNAQLALTDKEGNPLDPSDNQIKVEIMRAKQKMAEEQRALLREMLLMGVSRIVVDKGTVKAAVVFDVKATENIEKTDKATEQETTTRSSSTRSGFLSRFVASGGGANTQKRSRISVSSAKSTNTTEMSAQITGSVEINFKSDYFKLDNFAQMYGNQPKTNQVQGQGTNQGQLPAGG